jgi:transcriptional regulator with XRE-family HTH domain
MRTNRELDVAFGHTLQRFRLAAGVTQEDLGFRAELHRTYISLLERGLRTPTIDTLFRLCEALSVEPSEFLKEEVGNVSCNLASEQAQVTARGGRR